MNLEEKFLAVGDIHGCSKQLLEILEIAKNYPNHKLIFLGDYIDRGPDSDGVLSILKNLDSICLLGNHEEMLIDLVEELGEDEKFLFLREHEISLENYEWLKTLPLIFESTHYIFTHAGLNPNKPLKKQTSQDYLWTNYRGSYTHLTSKIVVQGHLHVSEVYREGNHCIIDTNCGLGGYLSGLVLPEMQIIKSKTIGKSYKVF